VTGYLSSQNFDPRGIDWYLIPLRGGEPTRTRASEAMSWARVQLKNEAMTPVPTMPVPGCWSEPGDRLVFPIVSGDTFNLWRMSISPQTGTVSSPERLTTGSANEVDPSCAGESVVFSSYEAKSRIFLLPLDSRTGNAKGEPREMTSGSGRRESLSLTKNGRFLAFVSDQSDEPNIWLRDMSTGRESVVARSPLVQRYPLSDGSGRRVVYSVFENDKRVLYMSSPSGGTERLCEGCLRPTDWTRDENKVIVFGGSPYTINVLDLATHRQTVLVQHPRYSVLYGRFSPDYRWISFTAREQPTSGRITIAPVDGLKQISPASWVTIANARIDDYAMWSDDGQTLYYTSSRDGSACIWGQKIDSGSGKRVGEAFAVRHFHGRFFFDHEGWSVGGGVIAIPLEERTGNVWMLSH